MDQTGFMKRGRTKKVPFVKWDPVGVSYQGVVLWTKLVPDFKFGTREPKLDDDGNPLEQLLVCILGDDGQWIIPVRDGSNLHYTLAHTLEEAGAEVPESGGHLVIRLAEKVTKGAITYNRFDVKYQLPPSGNGPGFDEEPPPWASA